MYENYSTNPFKVIVLLPLCLLLFGCSKGTDSKANSTRTTNLEEHLSSISPMNSTTGMTSDESEVELNSESNESGTEFDLGQIPKSNPDQSLGLSARSSTRDSSEQSSLDEQVQVSKAVDTEEEPIVPDFVDIDHANTFHNEEETSVPSFMDIADTGSDSENIDWLNYPAHKGESEVSEAAPQEDTQVESTAVATNQSSSPAVASAAQAPTKASSKSQTPTPQAPMTTPKPPANQFTTLAQERQKTFQLLRDYESFSPTAYWDVNAWRVGYGQDTVHGQRVYQGMRVSRSTAESAMASRWMRLERPALISQVGSTHYNRLNADQRAVLNSLKWNYGHVPPRVVRAIHSGDCNYTADSIYTLRHHDGGINAWRRRHESQIYRKACQTHS